MGRAGNEKIEGVVILSHANYKLIEFGTRSTKEKKSQFNMEDIDELVSKKMDTITILGCKTGQNVKGESNFATEMAKKMDADYTIASDSLVYHPTKRIKTNYTLKSDDGIRSKGFKVYTKRPNGEIRSQNISWSKKYKSIIELIKKAKKKAK